MAEVVVSRSDRSHHLPDADEAFAERTLVKVNPSLARAVKDVGLEATHKIEDAGPMPETGSAGM